MKINLKKILCITSIFVCIAPPAWSFSDEDIVQSLEALGKWKMAYPLAHHLAQQQNSYTAWRKVSVQYARFDPKGWLYLQTWQQAQKVNQVFFYKDFMTLKPQSAFNHYPIHAIFEITKSSNNIADYMRFMAEYPNTVESVEALLQIQKIAFERAKQKHEPLIYDAFVTTFSGAKQIPEAIKLAFEAEKQAVEKIDNGANYGEHERLARGLYSELLIAEQKQNTLVAARKYLLLSLRRFQNTSAFTDFFERKEHISRHKEILKKVESQHEETMNSIKEMRDAVIEVQLETQQLLRKQGQRFEQRFDSLENVIATHNRRLSQQLGEINKNIQQVNKGSLLELNLSFSLLDLSPVGVGAKVGSKIAKFVGKILSGITRTFKKPSKQQAVLFASSL